MKKVLSEFLSWRSFLCITGFPNSIFDEFIDNENIQKVLLVLSRVYVNENYSGGFANRRSELKHNKSKFSLAGNSQRAGDVA